MANAVYPLYKQSVLTEADTNNGLGANTSTDGPFCALVTSGYTYSSAHQFYSSLSNILGTDQRIANPTLTNGLFDGDDLTFTAVSGGTIAALTMYRKNSGANTTWRLFAYEDTGVTNLPLVTNGGNVTVTFNVGGIIQF